MHEEITHEELLEDIACKTALIESLWPLVALLGSPAGSPVILAIARDPVTSDLCGKIAAEVARQALQLQALRDELAARFGQAQADLAAQLQHAGSAVAAAEIEARGQTRH